MPSLLRRIYQTSPRDVYHFFADSIRARTAKNMVDRYMENHDLRKLHVGCGGNFLQSWLNTDLIPHNSDIVKLDAAKRFDIEALSFDYVYSEHLIEHLDITQQINFLNESFRILKPGGKIRISTPRFEFLAKLASPEKNEFEKEYLKWNASSFLKHIPDELMNDMTVDVYVVNNYFRDWGHQLIHSRASIRKLLEYSNFGKIKFEEVGNSDDPMLKGLEHHGLMITETYNKYETMVIEAQKPVKVN
jgi:predicted SAM-dependent methyltransferase